MMKMKTKCQSYDQILLDMWKNFSNIKKQMEILINMEVDQKVYL